uniref:Uncharacterized protein n=1 Tax=Anguilla anguilla TaxID=7936 RepID=A0A0E9XTX5_ANGAN
MYPFSQKGLHYPCQMTLFYETL